MSTDTATTPTQNKNIRDIALNVGAVAGVLCILIAAASVAFGIKPLIFRSGSMSPDITTGALGLSRTVPATELVKGDVVSVLNSSGTRITHRVVELGPSAGNSVTLRLKGDANTEADLESYTVTEADRVFLHLGGAGYLVAWLSSPIAIFLGGLFVGVLLVVAFRPSTRSPRPDVGRADSDFAEASDMPAPEHLTVRL